MTKKGLTQKQVRAALATLTRKPQAYLRSTEHYDVSAEGETKADWVREAAAYGDEPYIVGINTGGYTSMPVVVLAGHPDEALQTADEWYATYFYADDYEGAEESRGRGEGVAFVDHLIKKSKNPAVAKRGTHVKPTRFSIKDQGRPGVRSFGAKSATGKYAKRAHMKPLITHEGSLGGPGYTKKPAKTRHALLSKCVKKDSYRSCLGKLQVLLLSTEIKPATRKVLESDKKWLMAKFGGPGSFKKTAKKKSSRKKNPGKVSVRSLVAKALK